MRLFGWFSLLTLFWLLVELSFFEIVFPRAEAPVIIFALALALATVPDWRGGFLWAVGSVLLYDVIRLGQVTPLPLFILSTAALSGFLARRVTPDHSGSSRFVLIATALLSVALYESFTPFFTPPRFFDLSLMLVAWLAVSASVRSLYAWLMATSLSEFRGLRHS